MKKSAGLTWIEVAISLVTLHYGLGFLIGSGESIYQLGAKGILYGISTAIGIFSLLFITQFYWKKKDPIWTLMGKKYGRVVGESISFLSSIWMIGVVASQVQGGSSVLHTLGLPNAVSIIIMAVLITLLSLISLKRMVAFFATMLFFSSASLIGILFFLGIQWVPISTSEFVKGLPQLHFSDIFGVLIPTVLVTFIGMDFHQFLVKAKTYNDAKKGILSAFVILTIISILLLSVVNGAIKNHLLFGIQSARQTIPLILGNFGDGISPKLSLLLMFPIIFVAMGSGSGVNRIINHCMAETTILPDFLRKKPNVFFMIFIFVLLTSFSGDSIVGLIVAFYAIYVGSVFIVFLALLADLKFKLNVKKESILLAIYGSVIGTLVIFLLSYIPHSFLSANKASFMILVGFFISLIILLIYNGKNFRFPFIFPNKRRIYDILHLSYKGYRKSNHSVTINKYA